MGWNKGGYRGFDEGWNIISLPSPTVVLTANAPGGSVGGGLSTYTYSASSIGAASPTRRVIVTGMFIDDGNTVNSVTIDGNATTLTQAGSGLTKHWVASAVVATGTTAVVVVNYNVGNFTAGPIGIWTTDNSLLLSSTPTDGFNSATAATSVSTSTATSAGGFSLLTAMSFGAGTTWGFTSSDDTFAEDSRDNSNGRLWAHVNGTQNRTASTVMSSSATTDLYVSIWNFR